MPSWGDTVYRARRAFTKYRKAGYPGFHKALDQVYKYRYPIAGAIGWGAAKATKGKKSSKKVKLHQRVLNTGQGGSFSKFFYGKRKPKVSRNVLRLIEPNMYLKNGATRLTSGVGQQSATTQLNMFGAGDLETIFGIEGANKTERVLMMSCTASLQFTNQDVGNARITLYDCISRRDTSNGSINTPDAAWSNGYGDEGGTAGVTYLVPGVTPFSSDLFTQFYKVLKITHLILAQGQSHDHRVHYSPNRVFEREVDEFSTNIKGLSCFTMMVLSSVPYNDSTTKTQVSLGSGALDVVYRKQYKFKYLQNNIDTVNVSNTLPTSFTVSEDVMDIGSGAVVVDVSA